MPSNKIHKIDHDKNQTYQLYAPLRQSNNFQCLTLVLISGQDEED